MAYEKQTFVDNETVLTAGHLNHIEAGIASNAENLDAMKETAFSGHWDDLKGRPFGTETGMVEVLGETTVEMAEDGYQFGSYIPLTVGATYSVKYNGTIYERVCRKLGQFEDAVHFLGNARQFGLADSGEPFGIVSQPSSRSTVAVAFDGSATVTLSIHTEEEMVKKISGKYVEGMGYTEKGETVLPETTMAIDPETAQGFLTDAIDVEVGKIYAVNWNGTEYTCTAVNFVGEGGVGGTVLGNLGAANGGESTGEPFVFVVVPDEMVAEMGAGTICMVLDGSTSATVSIKEVAVHPLDPVFLPTVKVKFTQESDGTITADKTFEEVKAAYSSGYDILGVYTISDANPSNGAYSNIEYRIPLMNYSVGDDGNGTAYEMFGFSVLWGQSAGSAHGITIMFANSGISLVNHAIA